MAFVATSYGDAVVALYQAPHRLFTEERKRLALELKSSGDKASAARLAKLGRPTIASWAVNQLWWRARAVFEQFLATAERVRQGDRTALGAHREALTKLRTRAAAILREAGHPATDATLRRVTTTLSALAAGGGFDPEPPGALTGDRDPPGFETIASLDASSGEAAEESEDQAANRRAADADARRQRQTERARERAEAEAERRRLEEERAERETEQRRLQAALRSAKRDLETRTRAVERLRRELEDAEGDLKKAQKAIDELESQLA